MERTEREEASVDFTALVNAAIEAKRAEEVKWLEAESVPEGETLKGWNTTPEEVAQINAGNRAAVDRFYFDERNYKHIRNSAFSFFAKTSHFRAIISVEDLMQQVYLDLATGLIKLRPFDRGIGGAIFASFRFAAVGGLDEVYIVKQKRRSNSKWASGKN